MPQQPIRARIRRYNIPDALYFITAVTHERQPAFADTANVALLRQTMHRVQNLHPFEMRAYVFLPDHLHMLIHIPDTTTISDVMHSMQRNFTLNYKRAHAIEQQVTIWQRGFWDHAIRDDADWANHTSTTSTSIR